MARAEPRASAARAVFHILAKDMLQEWRSRAVLYTMVLFGALVVVICSFAFAAQGQPMHDVAGGILSLVAALAGTLGLARFFERELDTQRTLLMLPVSRAAIYLAKVLAMVVFVALMEAVVVPLVLLFYNLDLRHPALLAATLAQGAVGFCAVGVLVAASLLQSRSRELLLGLLLLPLVTPLIIATARASGSLLAPVADVGAALLWIAVLALFDLVFVVLALALFEPIFRAE